MSLHQSVNLVIARTELGMCDTLACPQSPSRVSVFLSMLSGEIDLRLNSYLVVKVSSETVTEHCCQVCVPSRIFAAPTAGCVLTYVVSDCAIKKILVVPRGWTLYRQANVEYEKYCLHLIFTFCWIAVETSKMTFISIHIITNQNSYHHDKSA